MMMAFFSFLNMKMPVRTANVAVRVYEECTEKEVFILELQTKLLLIGKIWESFHQAVTAYIYLVFIF